MAHNTRESGGYICLSEFISFSLYSFQRISVRLSQPTQRPGQNNAYEGRENGNDLNLLCILMEGDPHSHIGVGSGR